MLCVVLTIDKGVFDVLLTRCLYYFRADVNRRYTVNKSKQKIVHLWQLKSNKRKQFKYVCFLILLRTQ
jgi:hypothetical protein